MTMIIIITVLTTLFIAFAARIAYVILTIKDKEARKFVAYVPALILLLLIRFAFYGKKTRAEMIDYIGDYMSSNAKINVQ